MHNKLNLLSPAPSPPTVSIDPFNHLETAGQPLTLICSVSIQEGIRSIPVLTWTREDANLSSDVTLAPPLLSFPTLHTSHAGKYTCVSRLSIPETGVNIFVNSTTNVSIQCKLHCHYTYDGLTLVCVLSYVVIPPPPTISGSSWNNTRQDTTFVSTGTTSNSRPISVSGMMEYYHNLQ